MHQLSEADRQKLQAHPMGDVTTEKRGVFALRSPMRPNPIGLTRVRLVERKGNILIVEGLDAFDESPVIDIKPG
jgi:tRNA-Thr(GGU) m(6)t(6)A37 methyltransferase TsaA